MKSAVLLENARGVTIGFQDASIDIWDKKYRLKSKAGDVVDETMDDTYKRVARALADVEAPGDRERWFEERAREAAEEAARVEAARVEAVRLATGPVPTVGVAVLAVW